MSQKRNGVLLLDHVTPEALAQLVGVSRRSVSRWQRRGLRSRRVLGRRVFSVEDVVAWLHGGGNGVDDSDEK